MGSRQNKANTTGLNRQDAKTAKRTRIRRLGRREAEKDLNRNTLRRVDRYLTIESIHLSHLFLCSLNLRFSAVDYCPWSLLGGLGVLAVHLLGSAGPDFSRVEGSYCASNRLAWRCTRRHSPFSRRKMWVTRLLHPVTPSTPAMRWLE